MPELIALHPTPAPRLPVAAGARATIVEQKLTWHENALRVVGLFRGLMQRA